MRYGFVNTLPPPPPLSPTSPWSGGFQYVLDGVTARAKTGRREERRLPRCGIKQLCTSLSFPLVCLSPSFFLFPFLSFFFAAVKIGFSLLVNAGGAAAAAMSRALCKPPFPNAKSPRDDEEAANREEERERERGRE